MNRPTHIVIHCSDSTYGTVGVVDNWHKGRGWSGIGYHYLITNGHGTTSLGERKPETDGKVWTGRSENIVGAHAPDYNTHSLAVCLIGKDGAFTAGQLAALFATLLGLMFRHSIPSSNVVGHYEAPSEQSKPPQKRKTCPDLDMSHLRTKLRILSALFCAQMKSEGVA